MSPFKGVLPQGGDDADYHFLLHHFVIDRHGVEQSHGVRRLLYLDDLGGADHPFQIADAAVIAVFACLAHLYS